MTDIKEQWENYMELGRRAVKENGLREEFEKEIKACLLYTSRCHRMQGSEMWEEYNVNYILYSKQKTKKRVQGV